MTGKLPHAQKKDIRKLKFVVKKYFKYIKMSILILGLFP